jgi:predicted acylesterase/phospholipase RssA
MIQIDGKVGYALGGGVARGLFHIGVLSVLEENKISPDVIVGTSMGAIVGAMYASGLSAKEIKDIALDFDWRQLIRLADVTFPINGLIRGKRINALLKSLLKDITFENIKTPFACVATDITTGEQVVLSEGSLIESIRASISLPSIFTPVRVGNRYLVDGGLVNVVPISVCREMGADYVIGVNVIPVPAETVSLQEAYETYYNYRQQKSGGNRFKQSATIKKITGGGSYVWRAGKGIYNHLVERAEKRNQKNYPSDSSPIPVKEPRFTEVISQALSIVEYRIAMENLRDADVAITPFGGNIGFWQFNRVADAINAGEIAARLALHRDDIARIMLEKYNNNI